MITENLSTLKIHRLTQEQYDRAKAEGKLKDNEIYLTPDTAAGNIILTENVDFGDVLPEHTTTNKLFFLKVPRA